MYHDARTSRFRFSVHRPLFRPCPNSVKCSRLNIRIPPYSMSVLLVSFPPAPPLTTSPLDSRAHLSPSPFSLGCLRFLEPFYRAGHEVTAVKTRRGIQGCGVAIVEAYRSGGGKGTGEAFRGEAGPRRGAAHGRGVHGVPYHPRVNCCCRSKTALLSARVSSWRLFRNNTFATYSSFLRNVSDVVLGASLRSRAKSSASV